MGRKETAASSGASEGSGHDSERPAPADRTQSNVEAELQCSQLELQVTNAALAVVVRALRRSQQINSELRLLQKQGAVTGASTIDFISAVADELTNIPPGPPAASLLPIIMEQAIKETDAFNRAFYEASMAAPQRADSPDISQFSAQSPQLSVASPHSEYSLSSPAVFTTVSDGQDFLHKEATPLPPMQQFMWDSVLWPILSAKIDAIIAKSFIIEHLLDSAIQTCCARPYPSSSCITLPIWIDAAEQPALSLFILSHVVQPLQTLVAIAGLDFRVTGPLSSMWRRSAAGHAPADSGHVCPFWSTYATWGSLPLSFLVATAAEPAAVSVSILGQRLIQPFPYNLCSLGLIRRHNISSVPTSYHEISVVSLPPHLPIHTPQISCIISPQDKGSIALLQRMLLHGDTNREDESQLAASATAALGDWSLQQSPLQWLAAFQLKKRILQDGATVLDADHTVLSHIGHADVVSSLQKHLIQQLFVWFPNIRQAAESLVLAHKGGVKSVILRQMYQRPFLLLSDPFAFHRSISQLQVEQLPSRSPPPKPPRWATRKDFTGSSGSQCCDQSWFTSGRADMSKEPLLRAYPPCIGETTATSAMHCGSWQQQTTQLLLNSLATCVGREHEQLQVVEWFKSLSASLATRAVSHPPVAFVCGLKGSGKTTLLAASHRRFSNASSENFAPIEAVYLCNEVLEPVTSTDDFLSILSMNIVCALADSGLAAVSVTDASAAATSLVDAAREACSKRAVMVVVDASLSQLSAFMSASPSLHSRLPHLPGFMMVFTTTMQLPSQSSGTRDAAAVKLQGICDQYRAPYLELPMLDSRASLALVNSEISRYYHVAGHSQPADAESLSFSFHQFMRSVPVMCGHPLWIKAACRCACLLPNDWQSQLSGHSGRVSAWLSTATPQGQPGKKTDQVVMVPHPPTTPFKPNLASSLKATADRWKREGFDLFEKVRSNGVETASVLSGSKVLEPQAAALDSASLGAINADSPSSASAPSDRCSAILQDVFDVLIAAATSSLNLDLRSEFITEQTTSSSEVHGPSSQPRAFISGMLQLASACKCPVPIQGLSTACNVASGVLACVGWILHEVVLLSVANCVFVVRHSLLPKSAPIFNLTNLCFSLSVDLGHSVTAWSASVESALIADEDFFRTQPSKTSSRQEQAETPAKASQSSQPVEKLWFKLCANAIDSKLDLEHVLNSVTYSTFTLHSLVNCLAFARLGGLLQQWLMIPACAMLLGSSEMSRLVTRRLWTQSHELGALPAASVLLSETKRARAAGASLPALLSLLASANNYRLLHMYTHLYRPFVTPHSIPGMMKPPMCLILRRQCPHNFLATLAR